MSTAAHAGVRKRTSIGPRLRRGIERQLVGIAMSAAAWPLERVVLRSTRAREEAL